MPDSPPNIFASLASALKGELVRARDTLVPPAFQFLWEQARYIVAYGGRGGAKSWSIARVLLVLAHEAPLRVLCLREVQNSIKESAYRLLCDQVELLGLRDFYQIQSDCIIGANDSRFFFEGMRYNDSRIRSYEGIGVVWCEEAQSISDRSWEQLLPTIRKGGSRIFISFNPLTQDDPVQKRFVDVTPPGTIARKVSYRDNPYLSAESEAERLWLQQTDPDAYAHVWEGEPRTVSDAQILRGKYEVASFDIDPQWAGPFHGCDFGFSKDPSAAVRCHIDDAARILYISREFWRLGCDIDRLPGALEEAIPNISSYVVYCDSARPETISYLSRNGIARAQSAMKWPGSVDDGVMYLRSFAKIVIDPSCTHVIDEARSYSFKCDRMTGQPLPEVEDRHNHCLDALRYSLWSLIRNQAPGGYFSRAALLVNGEPAEPIKTERPSHIFGTIAMCERIGSAVACVLWAHFPHFGIPLRILHYSIVEIDEAVGGAWLEQLFSRAEELRQEWNAAEAMTRLWVEEGELLEALGMVFPFHLVANLQVPSIDLCTIETDTLPPILDQRASALRATVNGGRYVKFARSAYLQQVTHRSTTANHLVNQLLGYRPEQAKDTAQELTNAFCIGVTLVNRRDT